MEEHATLKELIRKCQLGESEGFHRLIQEYGPKLYSYFYRVSGSTSDAEDLLQELFVKLIQYIRRYKHQGRFEHWLFRIAANLARDRVRRLERQVKTTAIRYHGTDEDPIDIDVVSREPGPDEQMLRREQQGRLSKALDQLPLPDREMILLRHYGGLSFKEIAQEFNMPMGTVLSKVHRGLKALKRIMAGDENG